ncbi:hypothetical protein FACS189432_08930 [Bacteroidia bacterium]|nr:hypothetical protein FACS189426_11360 [Bacteroidia bacterium]GHT29711.1 hypothetical protein FACS189432_08930 [Bacteroidia bacterium]
MNNPSSIAFLIVYMGNLPWYFPYFLHSCRYNPNIDFFILTDNKEELPDVPPNVHLIPYSIEQFKTDAKKTLGFEVVVESGYKLCDFKPAYGYIFSDWIKDYDFWGYCDIDVIFGNIRAFMTEELLNEYDVISARHDYLTGCFALYRNNPTMRELFKQSKDYEKVFTDNRNFFFDETNFAFAEFEKGLHYSQIKTEVESMTHVVRRLQETGQIKAYFEFQIIEGFAGNMLWDKGTLIYRKEYEAMLYHLVRFKRKFSEPVDLQRQIPDRFRIGKKKIYY